MEKCPICEADMIGKPLMCPVHGSVPKFKQTVEEALKKIVDKTHARKMLEDAEEYMLITYKDGVHTSTYIGYRMFTMLGALEVAKSKILKDIEAHSMPLVKEEEEQ